MLAYIADSTPESRLNQMQHSPHPVAFKDHEPLPVDFVSVNFQ
jgi:hypothetical protein